MWEQLDKHIAEAALWRPDRPADSFTRDEFAAKYSLGSCAANYRISKLQKLGKVKRHGSTGRNVYYTLA